MGKKTDDWIDEEDPDEFVPSRKRKPRSNLAEDFDPEEFDEWGRERGGRGRKPADKKHRRPKPELDEDF